MVKRREDEEPDEVGVPLNRSSRLALWFLLLWMVAMAIGALVIIIIELWVQKGDILWLTL